MKTTTRLMAAIMIAVSFGIALASGRAVLLSGEHSAATGSAPQVYQELTGGPDGCRGNACSVDPSSSPIYECARGCAPTDGGILCQVRDDSPDTPFVGPTSSLCAK